MTKTRKPLFSLLMVELMVVVSAFFSNSYVLQLLWVYFAQIVVFMFFYIISGSKSKSIYAKAKEMSFKFFYVAIASLLLLFGVVILVIIMTPGSYDVVLENDYIINVDLSVQSVRWTVVALATILYIAEYLFLKRRAVHIFDSGTVLVLRSAIMMTVSVTIIFIYAILDNKGAVLFFASLKSAMELILYKIATSGTAGR